MHQLTTSGVPAETVADVIADAIAAEAPPLRHLVGDAEHLAALQQRHGDEVVEAFFLDGEDFRQRYVEMAGIDYWS
jgi:hypothetical protein